MNLGWSTELAVETIFGRKSYQESEKQETDDVAAWPTICNNILNASGANRFRGRNLQHVRVEDYLYSDESNMVSSQFDFVFSFCVDI